MPLIASLLLLSFASAFSTMAHACPKLAGKYHCIHAKDRTRETVVMLQETRNGVEIYTFKGPQLFADNIVRDLPESPDFKQGTLRAWCDGEFLRTKYTGKLYHENQYMGDLMARQSYQKFDTALTVITKGDISGGDVGANIDQELNCEEMTP